MQIQQLEQLGNRRDLVGLLRRLDLTQHHAIRRAEGTDHVDRPFAFPSAVRSTQRLTIDGHYRAFRHVMAGLHPVGKRALQLLGIHQGHDPGQGVMARHSSHKITVLAEKVQLRVAKILDLIPTFSTTDHRTDRQKQDVRQLMLHFPGLAEVGND